MTINHHPDDATLMSYSAGSLPEALSAVVASHVAICPRCAEDLAEMDAIGSALVGTIRPVAMMRATPAMPAASAGKASTTVRPRAADSDVPAPLARLVGDRLDGIQWKRLGYGVWHLPLPLSEAASGDLRLIKVAPGQEMPEHGHGGAELTLVLNGSYRDEVGQFAAGDLADLDGDVEHRPVADAETGCICLIASVERAKFKGLIARLVQPLTGM